MAKTATPSIEEILAKAKANMTPEQRAALEATTGANKSDGDATPKLKRNSQERKDSKGKRIAKGNWVVGQKVTTMGDKSILDEAGTDLGEELDVEILLIGQQYTYYSPDANKRCNSPLCFGKEINDAVGSKLGHTCSDKSCPRRAEGLDKKERCTVQWVVYLRLPEGTKLPDGTDCPVAKLYLSGDNYMPFKEYVNETLAGTPAGAVVTRITGEERTHGAVLYFVNEYTPTGLAKDAAANGKLGAELMEKLTAARASYKTKETKETKETKDVAAQRDNPAAQTAPTTSEPPFHPDDDIPF